MRIGVISNPRSQRNQSEMARMRELIESHDVPHGEIDHIAAVPDILKQFAADGVELVAISGGDGTVQAVLTALLNGNAFAAPPRVAVLAAGMTNLIAADVGMKDHPAEALGRLLEPDALNRGKAVERSVLSLQIDPAAEPVHGMFLATAGFHRAVMLVRRRVHSTGAVRNLAAGMGIAVSLLRLVIGYGGKEDLLQGDAIRVDIDGSPGEKRDYLLWMATTLDRFIMHLHPFWGSGPQALRYTAVPYPARQLALAIWPILRGRPRQWMAAAGYSSGRATALELTLDCPIVFDGEIFNPRAGRPVTLRADRRITFWQV
jgi:hypothetical protein